MFGIFSKKTEMYYFIKSLSQVLVPLCLNTATSIGVANNWNPNDRRNDYASTMLFSVAFVFLQPLTHKAKSTQERNSLDTLFSEIFYTNFNFSEISREINAKEIMLNCSVSLKQSLDRSMSDGEIGVEAYLTAIDNIFSEIFENFNSDKSTVVFYNYLNQLANIYQQGIDVSKKS